MTRGNSMPSFAERSLSICSLWNQDLVSSLSSLCIILRRSVLPIRMRSLKRSVNSFKQLQLELDQGVWYLEMEIAMELRVALSISTDKLRRIILKELVETHHITGLFMVTTQVRASEMQLKRCKAKKFQRLCHRRWMMRSRGSLNMAQIWSSQRKVGRLLTKVSSRSWLILAKSLQTKAKRSTIEAS